MSTSTIVTLRCAPSKYQKSGPRAWLSDVQHPSPSFFNVAVRQVGDAGVRPRKHAARRAGRPARHLKPSMLTSVVFQTSSRLSGASIGNRVTVAKSDCLLSRPGVHPLAAVGGVLPQRHREPVGELPQTGAVPVDDEDLGRPGSDPAGKDDAVAARREHRLHVAPALASDHPLALPSSVSRPIRTSWCRRPADPCRPPAPRPRASARPSGRAPPPQAQPPPQAKCSPAPPEHAVSSRKRRGGAYRLSGRIQVSSQARIVLRAGSGRRNRSKTLRPSKRKAAARAAVHRAHDASAIQTPWGSDRESCRKPDEFLPHACDFRERVPYSHDARSRTVSPLSATRRSLMSLRSGLSVAIMSAVFVSQLILCRRVSRLL